MYRIKLLAFSCLYLFIFSDNLYGQANDQSLINFTTNEGLSHFGLTSVLEDHKGYIWIGSYNGLNKFNGYDFEIFRNSDDKIVISNNKVRSLYQDKHHNIWIGTEDGITIYYYDQQKFVNFPKHLISNSKSDHPFIINKIFAIDNQIVCISEYDGLLFFNQDTYKIERVHPIEVKNKTYQYIFDAINYNDELILMTTSKGLLMYNVANDTHEYVFTDRFGPAKSITVDNEKNIYVALYNGITHLRIVKQNDDYKFHQIKRFFQNERFLKVDATVEGKLWLGSLSKGCWLVENPILVERNTTLDENSYSKYFEIGRVNAIMDLTKTNKVWISSYNEGLFLYDSQPRAFSYNDLNTDELRGQQFKNKVLESTLWDDEHILCSVYLRGLVNYNTTTNKIEPLPKEFKNNPMPNAWSSVIKDDKGGKWLRYTKGRGVWYYQPKEEVSHWYPIKTNKESKLLKARLTQITTDHFGYYWLTTNQGLYRVKMDQKGNVLSDEKLVEEEHIHISEVNHVKSVLNDTLNQRILVGNTLSGMINIDNSKDIPLSKMKKVQYFTQSSKEKYLPCNHISNIINLADGNIALGTEGSGLLILTELGDQKVVYKTYSESDGLDNNIIKKVVEDDEHTLWITTDSGLNRFNPKTKTFKHFTKENGMHTYAFENIGFKQKNGDIFFAGGNGICGFDPEKTEVSSNLPEFTFGDLVIINKTVHVNDSINGKVILDKPLYQQKEINLAYDQNIFSIELLSLHYSNPKSYKLKYRLLPQDDEWIETSSKFKNASFNGLPPGSYTLEAMASNSKDKWTEPIRLDIVISPPYWKTPLAYSIYVMIILVILFFVGRFVLNHTKLRHKLELEQVERHRVDELNKTKEKMFMNISHEFRTPITLITGPIQVLLKMFQSNQDAFTHLDLINRQSKKMLQLVNQVQDFHKAEQSILKLNKENFDFSDLIVNVKKDFEQLAEKQKKKLLIQGEVNQLFITADENKLEIILNNLLNNAFKFTKKGDTISIRYHYDAEGLKFKVEDTGIGVKAKDLPYVFDRYYQNENSNTYSIGSGIGLAFSKRLVEMHYGSIKVDSTEGEGTCFTVALPVEVNAKEAMNESRMQDLIAQEDDDEKQKILPSALELPTHLYDESLKSLNIFYVEDNEELRTFVNSILSDYFNVTTFVNGKECLDQLEKEWPDLIISDILMPELNGLELCQKIKSDVRTSHIPIILLTSRSSLDDKVKGLEVGADYYISKPFEMKHLIASVQMLLKNRKQLRERFQIDFPVEVEKKNSNKEDAIFIEKFYELIEENLENEDIDMNVFAKGLYLNRTTFFQKVKAITNYTPYELLKIYRLKKAAELLVQEQLPVADVCVRTGFKNRTHFSRMFKEYYGVSPSKYSKSLEQTS
ncbi:response regulator [Flammeovirga yaeyamensis]|uniref:histidine kinase n=1 Tax=Flammeovirga yaeyamensis TaxID=367791 RepID=A0AAX1NEL8_9BACT|nr:hybrid sensor histidine kinase/response regulator transcription factor [Flammeovirga yaeyamensis]MBB3699919.1 signal transduction histidine kinase/DNA-binding response OmpR family regulator/ligand-binding sensor domain-containing protein [Flammeovirga yaeyamensis]NMF37642.1 response regulator [Flammeovirga yaeyamensis]QWG04698.1 response regulator [Flammeovirga yaeyamensis]